MKPISITATIFTLLLFIFSFAVCVHAGTVEEIKDGSKKAAQDIKDGAIEAGKATVETGKQIKEGSQKAWKDVKEGVKEVGRDFKKAYEDTRDAIHKEVSGEKSQTEEKKKDTSQK